LGAAESSRGLWKKSRGMPAWMIAMTAAPAGEKSGASRF
jgi:hypothetical protein